MLVSIFSGCQPVQSHGESSVLSIPNQQLTSNRTVVTCIVTPVRLVCIHLVHFFWQKLLICPWNYENLVNLVILRHGAIFLGKRVPCESLLLISFFFSCLKFDGEGTHFLNLQLHLCFCSHFLHVWVIFLWSDQLSTSRRYKIATKYANSDSDAEHQSLPQENLHLLKPRKWKKKKAKGQLEKSNLHYFRTKIKWDLQNFYSPNIRFPKAQKIFIFIS